MDGHPASGFLELVRTRHETDRILSTWICLFVMALNVILALVLMLYLHLGERNCLFFLTVGVGLTLLTVGVVIRARNREHVARDRKVALSLIEYLRQSGADVSGYAEDEEYYSQPYGTAQIAGIAFMIFMFGMLPFWPFFNYNISTTDPTTIAWPMISVILGFIFYLGSSKVIFFLPANHDDDQCYFYDRFCESCKEIGITVEPPEITVEKKVRILMPIMFLVAMAGALLVALVYSDVVIMAIAMVVALIVVLTIASLLAVSEMNHHIIYQWTYEEYVLSRIHPLAQYAYEEDAEDPVDRRAVRKKGSLPMSLRLAELFLIIMCGMYLIKLFALGVDFNTGYYGEREEFSPGFMQFALMSELNAVLFVITLIALFAIRSRNIKGMRKVLRSCVTFTASAVITETIIVSNSFSHYFDFNIYLTAGILYVLFVLVLTSPKARAYFTPYGMEPPGVLRTLRYAFFGKMTYDEALPEAVPEEDGETPAEESADPPEDSGKMD